MRTQVYTREDSAHGPLILVNASHPIPVGTAPRLVPALPGCEDVLLERHAARMLAACVRDGFPYKRNQFYQTKPAWAPIFEPDSTSLSGLGDCVSKLNTAVPGYLDKDAIKDLTGIQYSDTAASTVTTQPTQTQTTTVTGNDTGSED